jgi:hypothetical protein
VDGVPNLLELWRTNDIIFHAPVNIRRSSIYYKYGIFTEVTASLDVHCSMSAKTRIVEPVRRAVCRYQPGKHVTAVTNAHATIEKARKRCIPRGLHRTHVTRTQRAIASCEVGASPRGQEPWNPEAEDIAGSVARQRPVKT